MDFLPMAARHRTQPTHSQLSVRVHSMDSAKGIGSNDFKRIQLITVFIISTRNAYCVGSSAEKLIPAAGEGFLVRARDRCMMHRQSFLVACHRLPRKCGPLRPGFASSLSQRFAGDSLPVRSLWMPFLPSHVHADYVGAGTRYLCIVDKITPANATWNNLPHILSFSTNRRCCNALLLCRS